MSKTYFIETWGCQMNELDTQRLSGHLKLRGYKRVESETLADLILLNTCSIRDKSEQKVYSHLGRLRELKESRELKIGVCGEHGGDPASIRFFHAAGLDYVSCSPYRVPIARLAAAQAELEKPVGD